MAEDVAGNFDPRVYALATKIVPGVLTAAMSPASIPEMVLTGARQLDSLITAEGPIDKLRRLAEIGTLVLVPTHSSNLDSIALGYLVDREGLPPVVYGAGKNLFSNPIVSFFMHNLGAYRVDRRVQARLYKDVLKEYATLTLEYGYDNIFFPGGTRCRSGAVEKKLKVKSTGRGAARSEFVIQKGEVYLENDKHERKASGSYYTPDYIVKYIVQQTVGPALEAKCEALRPRLREAQKAHQRAVENQKAFQKMGQKGDDPEKTAFTFASVVDDRQETGCRGKAIPRPGSRGR